MQERWKKKIVKYILICPVLFKVFFQIRELYSFYINKNKKEYKNEHPNN